MSSNISSQPRIAFIGATGGCALAALAHTLRANIPAVALARTPSKLTNLLEAQQIDSATISRHLTIVSGNAHDVASVKSALTPNGQLVDVILMGLGAAPIFAFGWHSMMFCFVMDQPQVCGTGTRTVMSALEQIYHTQSGAKHNKPLVSFISTTGVTRGPDDVPWPMRFLYHQILAVPHLDKKMMEDQIRDNVDGKDGKEKLFRTMIGVRPTLLTGTGNTTDGVGWQKIRAGTESKPALGYTVRRADVGEWIFRNVIESDTGRQSWEGHMVTLTS